MPAEMPPCKDCEERTEYGLCHDTCARYLAFKEKYRKVSDERYLLNGAYIEYMKNKKETYTNFNKRMRNR